MVVNDSIVGRKVGSYVVERKIGQGGMGEVYLLRHLRLPDTYAALKVFGGDGAAGERRFEQEALVAAAVGSHRVVKPLDLGELDDGRKYIVMEYVPGRSLAAELASFGAMPVLTALKIVYRVADTMSIAHAKGIIHRDLKPDNVMLSRNGDRDFVVKLIDFGVARASGALKVADTGANAIIGTPGYLSPEAAAGIPVDGRTDVFSLGVVLYQLLTGELPFPAGSVGAALVGVLTGTAPPASSRRPSHLDAATSSVDALVARALTREPAARPSMAQLQRAIHGVIEELVSAPGAARPDPLGSLASAVLPPEGATSEPLAPPGVVAAFVERLPPAGGGSSPARPRLQLVSLALSPVPEIAPGASATARATVPLPLAATLPAPAASTTPPAPAISLALAAAASPPSVLTPPPALPPSDRHRLRALPSSRRWLLAAVAAAYGALALLGGWKLVHHAPSDTVAVAAKTPP